MPWPYKQTAVSAERSQAEIRRLLLRYGCSAISTSEEVEHSRLTLRFARRMDAAPVMLIVRLRVQIPEPETRRRRGRQMSAEQRREQEHRRAWRVLFYAIKSRMEAITFGLESFEQAFLSHIEVRTDDGRAMTVGDWAIPLMREQRLALPTAEEGA